jgi:hypothetical protein
VVVLRLWFERDAVMLDTPDKERTASSIQAQALAEFSGKGKGRLEPENKARKMAEILDDYYPL